MFSAFFIRRPIFASVISIIIMGIASILWILVGFSLSFHGDHAGIIGDLEWFGLNNFDQKARDLLSGKQTIKEVAAEMVKSPMEKFIRGFGPQITIPSGLLFEKNLFPDPFNPRKVYDKTEFLFESSRGELYY